MGRAILMAVLVMAGCGGQPDPAPEPDYWLNGVGVRVEPGGPPWLYEAGFDARLDALIGASVRYAHGNRDTLRGLVIRFKVANTVDCGGVAKAGCYHASGWIDLVVEPQSDRQAPALEYLPLPHEILHAFIGDGCHRAAAWLDWQSLDDEINGWRLTYVTQARYTVPIVITPGVNALEPTC